MGYLLVHSATEVYLQFNIFVELIIGSNTCAYVYGSRCEAVGSSPSHRILECGARKIIDSDMNSLTPNEQSTITVLPSKENLRKNTEIQRRHPVQ
jgi:hypothetical protein